jgi:hypothetical protein
LQIETINPLSVKKSSRAPRRFGRERIIAVPKKITVNRRQGGNENSCAKQGGGSAPAVVPKLLIYRYASAQRSKESWFFFG